MSSIRTTHVAAKRGTELKQQGLPPTKGPLNNMKLAQSLFIGIDIGTSGVRACAINSNEKLLHTSSTSLPCPEIHHQSITQEAQLWWRATQTVLADLCQHIDTSGVDGICVNGTSGTVLLCDHKGSPLAPARMYNDSFCIEQANRIKSIAPENSAAHGASSGLAKLLYLQPQFPQARYFLHQADWIAGQLSGHFNLSDENNALKSGYDPLSRCWPEWLDQLNIRRELLPEITPPGTTIGRVRKSLFKEYGINPQCHVVSGTTDSIAAFIATGASQPGDAVTSLGSTLVLKVISDKPVYAAESGIYSHRLGQHWLAGGASNSGGNVIQHYLSQKKIDQLTPLLIPQQITGLNYYPLTQAGERFPINDPSLAPRLEPRPDSELKFFQGILEGISHIEHEGYRKLQQLGAPYPSQVLTAGGGSKNTAWAKIRQNTMGVNVLQAEFSEACYGSALLAKRGLQI